MANSVDLVWVQKGLPVVGEFKTFWTHLGASHTRSTSLKWVSNGFFSSRIYFLMLNFIISGSIRGSLVELLHRFPNVVYPRPPSFFSFTQRFWLSKSIFLEYIFTDRARSTTGRLCFDTCRSVCLSTPRGGTPARSWWGVPLPGGTPPQIPPTGSAQGGTSAWGYPTSGNRWSTWYAAVGMPLAFTQGDFLVSPSSFESSTNSLTPQYRFIGYWCTPYITLVSKSLE